jgi:hypothetical protein
MSGQPGPAPREPNRTVSSSAQQTARTPPVADRCRRTHAVPRSGRSASRNGNIRTEPSDRSLELPSLASIREALRDPIVLEQLRSADCVHEFIGFACARFRNRRRGRSEQRIPGPDQARVVFWISGRQAGMYALGEVVGPPQSGTSDPAYTGHDGPAWDMFVPIDLTVELWDTPILRTALKADPRFAEEYCATPESPRHTVRQPAARGPRYPWWSVSGGQPGSSIRTFTSSCRHEVALREDLVVVSHQRPNLFLGAPNAASRSLRSWVGLYVIDPSPPLTGRRGC